MSPTAHVRSGGPDRVPRAGLGRSTVAPTAPVYEQCCRWIVQTFLALENDTRMGMRLHATFVAVGLPPPTMGLEALVGGGIQGLETLKARMTREVLDGGSVLVGR